MKLFKFSFFITLLFFNFACTNSKLPGIKSKPEKQFKTIVEISVDPEKEMYSIGESKIGESGIKVARMKSTETANKALKEKVQKESYEILEGFFKRAAIYEGRFNKKIMNNLSEYVSAKVMKNAKTKKEWEYDTGDIFVLVSVEKYDMIKETKAIFIEHINKVLDDLKKVKEESSLYEEGEKGSSSGWLDDESSGGVEDKESNFDL